MWVVIAVCLLFACVTDCITCEVYNFTWWISGAAAVALMLLNGGPETGMLLELCGFCLMQLLLFSRLYGRADCYAFCVCAAAETACGFGFSEYLFQMLFAYGILAMVQLPRRNIDSRGNLKHPVPFLPYITVSFGMIFLFF